MQRHDERLRQLAREREHVLAVLAAVDAVLVLEQHDVDVGAGKRAGSANVVAARPLRDGAHDLRALRARRLVDDDELADVVDIADAEQRLPYVEGESANPARAGWERRKDRGTHGCAPLSPDARGPREKLRGSIGWLAA